MPGLLIGPARTMLPFELTPLFKAKPWGGRRLAAFGKDLPPGPVGESWEVADLPEHIAEPGRTLVRTGDQIGRSLTSLIATHPAELLGERPPWADGTFPLLVKILDANQHLSIQVHPDELYSSSHPPAVTKSETWFVMAAAPGAVIYSGLQPGVTHGDLAAAAGTSSILDLLRPVPAVAGEAHDLPAGTIHALGAGVMVAEVQTPSDTTFRLYDWQDEYSRESRPLHVTAALAATHLDARPEPIPALAEGRRTIVSNRYYRLDELAFAWGSTTAGALAIVMAVEGQIVVDDETQSMGTTVVVPAANPNLSLDATRGRALILELGVEGTQQQST